MVAVIALQHRSVWAATVFGISTLLLLPGIQKHKVVAKLAVIGMVGMVLLVPIVLAGYADNFIDSIVGSAERATNLHKGTFGSRMKGWERILIYWGKLNFMDQLLGEPFGGGYAGSKTSPHNMFYQTLLRTGVFGTSILGLFYINILVKIYFNLVTDRNNRFYPTLFFMLIIAQIAYYIPYGAQAEHGIILGIAASLARRKLSANQTEDVAITTTDQIKPVSNLNAFS
jgi:O-antigen ligase